MKLTFTTEVTGDQAYIDQFKQEMDTRFIRAVETSRRVAKLVHKQRTSKYSKLNVDKLYEQLGG
jgi:hypothetical protein